MDKNKLWKWLLLLFLVIWSFALITPLEKKVKLGLDLKGGSSFIVEVDQEDVARKLIESGQYNSTELIDENFTFALLVLSSLLLLVLGIRKFDLPAEADIGDKSVFDFLESQRKLNTSDIETS